MSECQLLLYQITLDINENNVTYPTPLDGIEGLEILY